MISREKEKQLLKYLKSLPIDDTNKSFVKYIEKDLKPIAVRSRKNKGRSLQIYVAKAISHYTGIPYGKDELISSRIMGCSGNDVVLIGEAKKKFPWSVECKNVESINIWNVKDQAESNLEDFDNWLIVMKKNGQKPLAILDFDVFMENWFKEKQ